MKTTNGDCPVRKVILISIFILLVLGMYIGLIFNVFKPYYEVYINNNFIGYYSSYDDYENAYNKARDCSNEEYETTKYFAEEPVFKKVFIKTKCTKKVDNQELIKQNLETDYTVYGIIVNNEEKMYVKTKEEAEETINGFKDRVKDTTDIQIVPLIVKDLSILQLDETKEDICNQIVRDNLKVTSRGGIVREINTGLYDFEWPTQSQLITAYYGQSGQYWSNGHQGIDIGIPVGTDVMAAESGTITTSGWSNSYGWYVIINHGNNITSLYAHNSQLLVKINDYVEKGAIIAKSGSTGKSTGPHLHFEIKINGVAQNPLSFL